MPTHNIVPGVNNVVEIDLGDIYSGEERNVIASIILPKLDAPVESIVVVKYTLTYFDVITSLFKNTSIEVTISRPEVTPPNKEANIKLDKQRNRIIAAEAMENGRKLADAGNLDQGRTVVAQAITEIKNSASKDDIYSQTLVADLELCLENMQKKDVYHAKASKMMAMKESEHKKERATHESPFYQTKEKMAMKMKSSPSPVVSSVPVAPPVAQVITLSPIPASPLPPPPLALQQSSILPPPLGKIVKKLIVGNTHEDVVNPTDNYIHKWKFYVKFEDNSVDIGSIIDKVIVELHPTFPDPIIEISKAPFEIEKKGWGVFVIKATIYFKANQHKPDMTVDHYLSFDNDGKFSTYDITIDA